MDVPKNILFVSLTRPAITRLGIPHKAAVLLIVGTEICALWFGLRYYFIAIPLFIILRALTEWDHNFFRLIHMWSATKRRALRRGLWGGSKLAALPAGLPYNVKDIAGAI